MGDVVIAAYRPKPGREADLLALTRAHVPELRAWGLATDRAPLAMLGEGGVVIEVFEWCEGAIARAHEDPRVQSMWERYAQVCDYVPLAELPETSQLFAQFAPIDLPA